MSATHLLVAPIVLPLAAGALLVTLRGATARTQAAVSVVATVLLAIVAAALAAIASAGEVHAYLPGNWTPPFGIALALDRLSGLMLALVALLALASLAHALTHWHARGEHFHALFQFQLMGLNGAFLTADLFNLFVFFEVLLIASYGLLLHAPDPRRTRAAIHYVAVNLTGSALFLIGVGMLYGLTGTLGMADLAMRIAQLPEADIAIARAAGGLLLTVFCIKAAALPLYFWLPGAYSAATAPVAALFAIMTKVGVYAILRVFTLDFGPRAGLAALVAEPFLSVFGLATLALGALGALAARTFATLAAFLVVASAGTLLAAFSLGTAEGLAAGLFYLAHSTVAASALFLLTESVASRRAGLAAALFVLIAVAVAGIPPLSGFVAKLLVLEAVAPGPGRAAFWTVLLASSFVTLVALSRMGSRLYWKGEAAQAQAGAPPVTLVPVATLAAVLVALSVGASPLQRYTAAAAAQLREPGPYIERLLGARPVVREGRQP